MHIELVNRLTVCSEQYWHCCWLHFAWVVDDAKCIVVTRVCVCVSVRGRTPHYCTDPDVTWGRSRGCPLVVHYWRICNRCTGCVAMATNANPSLRGVCARCWLVTGGWRRRSEHCAPYIASRRGWLAGDWPSTGDVLNITAAAWTDCGLPLVASWQHSANAKC